MAHGSTIKGFAFKQQTDGSRITQDAGGTSCAAALVSGLAALIISIARHRQTPWTREVVYDIIRSTVRKEAHHHPDRWGCGLINVDAALAEARIRFP